MCKVGGAAFRCPGERLRRSRAASEKLEKARTSHTAAVVFTAITGEGARQEERLRETHRKALDRFNEANAGYRSTPRGVQRVLSQHVGVEHFPEEGTSLRAAEDRRLADLTQQGQANGSGGVEVSAGGSIATLSNGALTVNGVPLKHSYSTSDDGTVTMSVYPTSNDFSQDNVYHMRGAVEELAKCVGWASAVRFGSRQEYESASLKDPGERLYDPSVITGSFAQRDVYDYDLIRGEQFRIASRPEKVHLLSRTINRRGESLHASLGDGRVNTGNVRHAVSRDIDGGYSSQTAISTSKGSGVLEVEYESRPKYGSRSTLVWSSIGRAECHINTTSMKLSVTDSDTVNYDTAYDVSFEGGRPVATVDGSGLDKRQRMAITNMFTFIMGRDTEVTFS